jgi:hypothetical protein
LQTTGAIKEEGLVWERVMLGKPNIPPKNNIKKILKI